MSDLPTLTLDQIRETVGKTWFDFAQEDTSVILDTRQHGDVGEEEAGAEDKDEGRRIIKALRAAYPPTDYRTRYEVVDEWVTVTIDLAPYPPAKRKAMREDKLFAEWLTQRHREADAANQLFTTAKQAQPFYLHGATDKKYTWTLQVAFGVVSSGSYLPRPFATPEEAREAGDRLTANWKAMPSTVLAAKDIRTASGRLLYTHGSVVYTGIFRPPVP